MYVLAIGLMYVCSTGTMYVCSIGSMYVCSIGSMYVCLIGSMYACLIGLMYACLIGSMYVCAIWSMNPYGIIIVKNESTLLGWEGVRTLSIQILEPHTTNLMKEEKEKIVRRQKERTD